jgi:hypothetical protein
MSADRLQFLFQRHLDKTLTPEEKQELFGLSLEPAMNELLKNQIYEAWETTGEEDDLPESSAETMMNQIFVKRTPVLLLWKRIAVAASILLAIGLGSYLLFFNKPSPSKLTVQDKITHDVEAPKITKATITTADGKTIAIDSLTHFSQDNVTITKTGEGKIIYSPESAVISGLQYNTLTNPRGSKVIDMTLSDGSHVWLNAGSSVTYPVAFTGNERRVSITGEAYFEIEHNAAKPFIVSKADVQVQVLGTHFNVNAYDDEPAVKVTLLEGSVRVNHQQSSVVIKPGQQAQVTTTIKIKNNVDTDEVMAWKNGRFELNGNTIEPIMRQVARWYDVDIEYNGPIPTDNFMGGTSRQANVSELLNILEQTKTVKFRVEGKKIIVSK